MSDLLSTVHRRFRGGRAVILRRIIDLGGIGGNELRISLDDLARECGYAEQSGGFKRMLRDLVRQRVLLVRSRRGQMANTYAVNPDVESWERAA